MWQQELKDLNVSIHLISTGAGAGLQNELWSICGSSAYLSGASFPYAQEEQEEILGFMPTKFCSKEAAIDLASAAYMKAFQFGKKSPVGIGITASVATDKPHRGEHCFYTCVITDTKAIVGHYPLIKGSGAAKRIGDGHDVDFNSLFMMLDALGLVDALSSKQYEDAMEIARARFFERPFFSADGKRHSTVEDMNQYGLLSGSFNPPHEGHFGMASAFAHMDRHKVLFEMPDNPPHKPALSIHDLLKRAKMLKGQDRIFTHTPMFIDKVKAFPGMPLIIGTDTLDRLLDPKWGISINDFVRALNDNNTDIFVAQRMVDGKLLLVNDVLAKYRGILEANALMWLLESTHDLPGKWDISSTELRKQKEQDNGSQEDTEEDR
jgi:nicotinamide mononucleotide (NMN) deamidase PncC